VIFIGIDPGLNGAIAQIVANVARVWDMPTVALPNGKRAVDAGALSRLIGEVGGPHTARAAVEDVHAMPGQGVASMFNFGRSLGVIEGALAANGIPYIKVRPQTWKAHHGLMRQEKDASRARAIKLFPHLPLALKKHEGRAEAMLIASWLSQQPQE